MKNEVENEVTLTLTLGKACGAHGISVRDLCKVCGLQRSGMYSLYKAKPQMVEVILIGLNIKQTVLRDRSELLRYRAATESFLRSLKEME